MHRSKLVFHINHVWKLMLSEFRLARPRLLFSFRLLTRNMIPARRKAISWEPFLQLVQLAEHKLSCYSLQELL
jgi:hypothetical protein